MNAFEAGFEVGYKQAVANYTNLPDPKKKKPWVAKPSKKPVTPPLNPSRRQLQSIDPTAAMIREWQQGFKPTSKLAGAAQQLANARALQKQKAKQMRTKKKCTPQEQAERKKARKEMANAKY